MDGWMDERIQSCICVYIKIVEVIHIFKNKRLNDRANLCVQGRTRGGKQTSQPPAQTRTRTRAHTHTFVHVYAYVYIYIFAYIYIYIYIYRSEMCCSQCHCQSLSVLVSNERSPSEYLSTLSHSIACTTIFLFFGCCG